MSRRGRDVLVPENLRKEAKRTVVEEFTLSFDEAQKEFIRECELKDYAEDTLIYYRRELKYVKRLLMEVGASLDNIADITAEQLQEIVALQKSRNLKTGTVHARMRAVRTLFNWAVTRGRVDESPMEGVVVLKPRHQVGAAFTKRQLKRLLDAPDLSTFFGLRDYVLMLTKREYSREYRGKH